MKIRTELFHIRTAPLGGCSPLPHFRARKTRIMPTTESFPKELAAAIGNQVKTLPYLMQDRYTHDLEQKALKSFVLENEYLKARFLPEYGGRGESTVGSVRAKKEPMHGYDYSIEVDIEGLSCMYIKNTSRKKKAEA